MNKEQVKAQLCKELDEEFEKVWDNYLEYKKSITDHGEAMLTLIKLNKKELALDCFKNIEFIT